MSTFKTDTVGVEELVERLTQFGEKGEEAVNEVFANEGYERVAQTAQGYIHASGRTFKGHTTSATAASSTTVFGKEAANLSVTVKSQGQYRYLYFPDDGSNTRRHAGNQHFMREGAEGSLPTITEAILKRLTF